MLRKVIVMLAITIALLLAVSVIALAGAAQARVVNQPASQVDRPPEPPWAEAAPPEPEQAAPQVVRGERPILVPASELRHAESVLSMDMSGIGGGPFENSYFFDDMESGSSAWTASGLWHRADGGSAYPNAYNGSASWWYGQENSGNYDTVTPNHGALQTGPISLPPDAEAAYLRFFSWELTEDFLDTFDTRKVLTSTNGMDWTTAFTSTESTGAWHEVVIDLSGSVGQGIYVRFEFDTVDDSFNAYRGWYIDDVAVGYDRMTAINEVQIGYGLPDENISFPVSPYRQLYARNHNGLTTTYTATISGLVSFGPSGFDVPNGVAIGFGLSPHIPADAALGTYYDTLVNYDTASTVGISATQLARTWVGKVDLYDYTVIDDGRGQSRGNGNGQIDPGEIIELDVSLKNYFDVPTYATSAGFSSIPYVSWYESTKAFGDISAGTTISATTPYVFEVQNNLPRGEVLTFTLNTTARDGLSFTSIFTATYPHVVDLGMSPINAALPGSTMTYTLVLSNETGLADSFQFSTDGGTWPTGINPNPTGSVPDGGTTSYEVQVQVPGSATLGDLDTQTLETMGTGPAAAFTDTLPLYSFAGKLLEGSSPPTTTDPFSITLPISPLGASIYLYDQDHDTLNASFEGYNPVSGAWELVAEQVDGGGGWLFSGPLSTPYNLVRVSMEDTEYNDLIYFEYRFAILPTIGLLAMDQNMVGPPGGVISYTQGVFNWSGEPAVIDLSASGYTWPTTLLSGTQVINRTPELQDDEFLTFTVRVELPDDASTAMDSAIIQGETLTGSLTSQPYSLHSGVLARGWALGFTDEDMETNVFVDAIKPEPPWQLTDSRVANREIGLSAFRKDGLPVTWQREYTNVNGVDVAEVILAVMNASGGYDWGPVVLQDLSSATHWKQDLNPVVAVDPVSGNVGVTWFNIEEIPSYGDVYNIYAAVYAPDGQVLRPPTALTNDSENYQYNLLPAIEAFRTGEFAVTWQHYNDFIGSLVLDLAVLDPDGTQRGDNLPLITSNLIPIEFPHSLVQLLDGSMMLVTSCGENNFMGPYGEACYAVFDRTGELLVELTPLTNYLSDPDSFRFVTLMDGVQLSSGEIVIGWYTEEDRGYFYSLLDEHFAELVPPTELECLSIPSGGGLSLTEDALGRAVFAHSTENPFGGTNRISVGVINPDGSRATHGLYRTPTGLGLYLNWMGAAAGGADARPTYSNYLPVMGK